MSRTLKTDRRDWSKRTDIAREQQGCPNGKRCGTCGDLRDYAIGEKRRKASADDQIRAWLADPEPYPWAWLTEPDDDDYDYDRDDDHDRDETFEEWLASFPIYILNPHEMAPHSVL